MRIIKSIHSVNKRFTNERWLHIIENHDDLTDFYDDIINTIEIPDLIIKGYGNAKIALRKMKKDKYLEVVYKEITDRDGFVITAYFTSKIKLNKEVIIWKGQ